MKRFTGILIFIFMVGFITNVDAATYGPNQVFILPQDNYGGNSYQTQRYNNEVHRENERLQRQYQNDRLFNQQQQTQQMIEEQNRREQQKQWNSNLNRMGSGY